MGWIGSVRSATLIPGRVIGGRSILGFTFSGLALLFGISIR
jgi:hypothetical protein